MRKIAAVIRLQYVIKQFVIMVFGKIAHKQNQNFYVRKTCFSKNFHNTLEIKG